MRFHLEDHTEPLSDIDRTGIFARALYHTRPRRRQFLQMHARAFVRAMLGPHHGKHSELCDVRLTTKDSDDLVIFVARQIVLSDKVWGDRGHTGLHHNLAITATKVAHNPVVRRWLYGRVELAAVAQATEQDRRSAQIRLVGQFLHKRKRPEISTGLPL